MKTQNVEKVLLALSLVVACKGSQQPRRATDSAASKPGAASASASASVSPQPQRSSHGCDDPTIRQERVGRIRIGDPVDSLSKCNIVRDTVVPDNEGGKTRKVFIALAADTIAAEIVDGRVWRIEVFSPGIRTVDSLGVGTRLPRLLQLSNPRGASGEGRMFVLSPDHCGQSFGISHFGPMPKGGWTRAALAQLPDTIRVIHVLVVACHPELYQ